MYFENKIQNLRLTIDDNLFFYSPITGIKFKEKFIIVEIKYQKNIEFINSLDKLRFTRYSKYVKGTSQTTFPRIVIKIAPTVLIVPARVFVSNPRQPSVLSLFFKFRQSSFAVSASMPTLSTEPSNTGGSGL